MPEQAHQQRTVSEIAGVLNMVNKEPLKVTREKRNQTVTSTDDIYSANVFSPFPLFPILACQ